MPKIEIYYHDRVEVDPDSSWTCLCPFIKKAFFSDIKIASNPRVKELFGYARPDIVITVNDEPVVSIEQTAMNPSGHNIPQRFSFQVKAAELGVPSILFYPEKSRRTFSDPNIRYLNPRVPLAQLRLTELFDIPALSVFWPINKESLPTTDRFSQSGIARLVEALVTAKIHGVNISSIKEVRSTISEMDRVIQKYSARYRSNDSIGDLESFQDLKNNKKLGFCKIEPPNTAELFETFSFLKEKEHKLDFPSESSKTLFLSRSHTLVFSATANNKRTDSEHPWPGYFTLLDILYCRKGTHFHDRKINLVYSLPIRADLFVKRANQKDPPTATHIVDVFSDLILLKDGAVFGQPLRGALNAKRI